MVTACHRWTGARGPGEEAVLLSSCVSREATRPFRKPRAGGNSSRPLPIRPGDQYEVPAPESPIHHLATVLNLLIHPKAIMWL